MTCLTDGSIRGADLQLLFAYQLATLTISFRTRPRRSIDCDAGSRSIIKSGYASRMKKGPSEKPVVLVNAAGGAVFGRGETHLRIFAPAPSHPKDTDHQRTT